MILAGSDENTRPMRRVACRSVGRRILILAAMTPVTVQGCPATARDRLVSRDDRVKPMVRHTSFWCR